MKKIKTQSKLLLILTLSMSMLLSSITIMAADEPSSWALEEVNSALSQGFVPSSLQNGYQTDIKRYEYVLLALELLKEKKINIKITSRYPFTDIYDHPYEDEIVQAYNAGIIKGNGDGTFRPDDPITRQEIASLVVNLVKVLDQKETLDTSSSYEYSDQASISSWAKGYINYCYNNNIMNGVGKDGNGKDRIQPLGKATREQAILLLYRLGHSKGMFDSIDLGTISVTTFPAIDSDNTSVLEVESNVINDFAKVFGQELALKVIELSKKDNVQITSLSESYVLIYFINEGKIIISNDGFTTEMTLELLSLNDRVEADAFVDLASSLHSSEALENALNRDINVFETDPSYTLELELSKGETYSSRAESYENRNAYIFKYQLTRN